MTKEEFIKLANKTYSFTQLDAKKQKEILSLEGADRDFYVKLFEEENAVMNRAYKEFQKDIDEVVVGFTTHVKQEDTASRTAKEHQEKDEEEKALTNLLNKM